MFHWLKPVRPVVLNKPARYSLTAILAAIAAVGLVEVVLHVALPVEQELPNSFIFNNRIPGFAEKVKIEVGTDYLRRKNWPSGEKPAGQFRIVCLGGRSTVGQLQNVGDTWWGQLQERLAAADPSTSYAIAALALDSKGIRFGAKWAQLHLPELEPDLVIVQYGIEDILNHAESYRYDPLGSETVQVRAQRSGLKKILLGSSQIARRISRSRQATRQKLQQKQFGQQDFIASRLAQARGIYQNLDLVFAIERVEGGDPLQEYMEGLRALVTSSRESGAEALLVGEPSLCGEFTDSASRGLLSMPVMINDAEMPLRKPEPGWVEGELFRYYAHAKEYADTVRVPFVNLHGEVPQDPEFFFNEAILTDAGAERVAELLLPETRKLLGK